MFDFSREEKLAILFLLGLILSGSAISYFSKIYPPLKKIILQKEELLKIDINSIDLDNLPKIKGISQKVLEAIINYRSSNGDFSSLREVLKVKGVGEKRLQRIEEYFYLK